MKKAIFSIARRAARSLGCELVPSWHLQYWEIATHLRVLFSQLDIQCVLDVGAHMGQYRDFLRLVVGYSGQIISFEPVPSVVEVLMSRAQEETAWKVYPFALGDTDDSLPINIATRSDYSSFLTPDSCRIPELYKISSVARREIVPVRQLDSVIDLLKGENRIRNVFLKMDTQGYDLKVVKGGRKTLREVLALQSEIAILPLYAGMPQWVAAIDELKQYGFELSGIFAVGRDRHCRLIECDCVMVNAGTISRDGDIDRFLSDVR